MAWSIECTVNTVVVPKTLIKELIAAQEYEEELWYRDDQVLDDEGHLTFNPDHMEHMDYMWNEKIQAVLKAAYVKGDICFQSLEGDNEGESWAIALMVKAT